MYGLTLAFLSFKCHTQGMVSPSSSLSFHNYLAIHQAPLGETKWNFHPDTQCDTFPAMQLMHNPVAWHHPMAFLLNKQLKSNCMFYGSAMSIINMSWS